MNMNENPSIGQLRELIRACDDLAGDHVLWIARNGEVHLTRVPKDTSAAEFEQAEMQLRCETFEAGNEYVGPEAAEDSEWVQDLFDSLTREWPRAKDKSSVELFLMTT